MEELEGIYSEVWGRRNREMVFLKMYEFGLSAVGVWEVEVVGGASNCPPTLFSFSVLA